MNHRLRFAKSSRQMIASGLLILGGPGRAVACTMCAGGPTGDGVNPTRAMIFSNDFTSNLLLTLVPFAVVGAIVTGIHFAFPEPGNSGSDLS